MRTNSKIKYVAIAALALVALQAPADKAEAYVSIDIHIGAFPNLVPVPGYPVYYAPSLDNNLFFYDGLYWVYLDDEWYSSEWYDGPWDWVGPFDVPEFILRVPVRYYRRPPFYFHAWSYSEPPRWGEHWGRDWEYRRHGWDQWDRLRVPPPAPLPFYQRDYRGDRYPRGEQQHEIMQRHYRYQPGQQSGFQGRIEHRDEGPGNRWNDRSNDRGGPPSPNVTPPRSQVGPNFGQRDDRDRGNDRENDRRDQHRDTNRPPEINRPDVNGPPVGVPRMNPRMDDGDRANPHQGERQWGDRQGERRQWGRDAAPAQPNVPSAPRELAPPAPPRGPSGAPNVDRALRPAPNNEGPHNRPPDNRGGGFIGGAQGPMRNHDRDQGRDRDRDKDR